jgi:hypothetical protein
MAEGAYGKLGFARVYALIFGIVYLAVALVEFIVGDFLFLEPTTIQAVVHLAVGLVVLGSYFAGEAAARTVARIIGIVFVALTVWGFVAPDSLGNILGYDGAIPVAYNIIHLVTALVALFAGFAGRSTYRTAPAA